MRETTATALTKRVKPAPEVTPSQREIDHSAAEELRDMSAVIRAITTFFKRVNLVPSLNSLLIIGAEDDDLEMARRLGFERITCSNIDGFRGRTPLDAEAMQLPDNSYDVVFAHAVLHHCQCPHKAVLEAVRVCRKHFMFLEGNDSALMRLAKRLKLHRPYEIGAVIAHNYECGGVRNSAVPNHVYRWSRNDLEKTVNTGFPERTIEVSTDAFFDFYMTAEQLRNRNTPPIDQIVDFIGPSGSLRLLRLAQALANSLPIVRGQGNHFFAGISKKDLKPWIEASGTGYRLKRPETAQATIAEHKKGRFWCTAIPVGDGCQ